MVTFTCSYCGDSIRKNQVEKHYTFKRCASRSPALTCVDCLKDFFNQEYVAHTSCITEDEKYSAKGFVSKNAGKKKQEAWVDAVHNYLNSGITIDNRVRNVVQQICNNPGLPQKKVKFMNFCVGIPAARKETPHVLESVWEVLEKIKTQLRSQNADNLDKNNTDNPEDRKRKRVDSGNEPSKYNVESPDNSNTENSISTSLKLKKKQKSNKIPLSEEHQVEMNEVELEGGKNNDENSNECEDSVGVSGKIKSKKHRKLQESGELEHIAVEQSTPLNGSVEKNEVVKLSKKERKQKLKQEKYEKELKEVENEVSGKLLDDEIDVEETEKKKKKKKKNVKVNNGHTNASCELESHEELEVDRKKKNAESRELQESEFKGDTQDVATSKPSKFNWEETIIKVLEAKGDLLLKRLEKKVVSEYLNCNEHATSVEGIAKFNKKVLKIPRVKVKKEVARLVS